MGYAREMSSAKDNRERKVAKAQQADLDAGFAEYREQRDGLSTKSPYDDVIAATPEPQRDWIRRISFALESSVLDPRRRLELESFLERVRLHLHDLRGDVLSAVMSFIDAQDHEKRPWFDDSRDLWTALEYSAYDIFSIIAAALADGNADARKTAAKMAS
jgi:hypothetical protein